MITISILGLDQFVVGHYSKDHTPKIAGLYGVPEDAVNFYAPNSMVFHSGAEQPSWNTIVIVKAPNTEKAREEAVADYIMDTLSLFSIHVVVEFEYYEPGSHYERINPQYPRYLSGDNIKEADVSFTYGEEEDEGDDAEEGEDNDAPNPADRADLDPNDPNQIFLGNAFEGFEEALKKKEGK